MTCASVWELSLDRVTTRDRMRFLPTCSKTLNRGVAVVGLAAPNYYRLHTRSRDYFSASGSFIIAGKK